MFAVVLILLMLVPGTVMILTAWIASRKIGPRWPSKFRSTSAIVVLSLVPAAMDSLLLAVLAGLSVGTNTILWAMIAAGVLGGGWILFLLFVTRQAVVTSGDKLWAVRIWLILCLLATGFLVVACFALGVSQGIH